MKPKHSCPLCLSTSELYRICDKDTYFECQECKAIFLSHKSYLSKDEEFRRYQLHENKVEDIRYQNFVRPLVDAVKEDFSSPSLGLDFGCGSGPVVAKMLSDSGYEMKKYDPYFFNHKENLDRKYDFIVCCEVMEHFYNPNREFSLLSDLLRPGGKLVAKTNLIDFEIRSNFEDWYYKDDPTHVFFYAEETLEWIKIHKGFSNLWINDYFFVLEK